LGHEGLSRVRATPDDLLAEARQSKAFGIKFRMIAGTVAKESGVSHQAPLLNSHI
jgi:hypothetical protein